MNRYGQAALTVARLISLTAVAGVLVAAALLPVIAKAGITVRNEADKVTAAPTTAIGSIPQRSEILDSSGHLLAYIYGVDAGKNASASGVDRQPVTFSQIAPAMRKAIVAIEDDRFWTSGALDLKGTIRAAVNDLRGRPVQGGSTITQQYVKNMLILSAPNPEKAQAAYVDTLSRKLRELRMAVTIEHDESRAQILTGYLNDAYFGNLAYGVQVAAETYFGTTAAHLTLPQAATLAGVVENPSAYDPITNPKLSRERRNTVLARMAQTKAIPAATAAKAEATPLTLHPAPPPNGCSASLAGSAAFFCQYVMDSLLQDPGLGKTVAARAKRLATGGLKIYTTLNPADQKAASDAVNYMVPPSGQYNPSGLADAQAMVQPGTGKIMAIAQDRTYGGGKGQTYLDYAAGMGHGGGEGVQTGSSTKLFVLVTALKQGIPFGYTKSVPFKETIKGYTNCEGAPAGYTPGPGEFRVQNASTSDTGKFTLYMGTTQSINTFYSELEKKVGLCNVIKTAVALGDHRGDGTSLMQPDKAIGELSADNYPSFVLGSINVAPITMAAAYASVAARGIYCKPVAIDKIVSSGGKDLAAPSAGCHRVMSATVADAVNYILQGVLTQPGATAQGLGIGRPAAGKTGTAGGATGAPPSATFAGYTPGLASYTWVGGPNKTIPMSGYPDGVYRLAPGGTTMYGATAPAHTWQMAFEHAGITGPYNFVSVPHNSPFFSKGNGQSVSQTSATPSKPGHGSSCLLFCGGNSGSPSPAPTLGSPGGGPGHGGPPGHG